MPAASQKPAPTSLATAARPLRLLISGKMGSGKGVISDYLMSRYGARRMPREDIIKPFVYGAISHEPEWETRLAELFPGDREAQREVQEDISRYLQSYVDEGGKRRQLLQDMIDFVQARNPAAIEQALDRRIQAAAATEPFIIIDDARGREAFDFFKSRGYLTIRVEASEAARRRRMLKRDGVVPSPGAFAHWTETALDDAPFDYVIENEDDDPASLYAAVETILADLKRRA